MLKNNGRSQRNITSICGEITFTRTILVPKDQESREKLLKLYGSKSVAPLDCALKIDNLPFKITVRMMLNIAKEAVRSMSYVAATEKINEDYGVSISATTVKDVTDYVGAVVFAEQLRLASEAKESTSKKFDERRRRHRPNDVLFLLTDGAMMNLREDDEGTTKGWHESKHAVVFHSSNVEIHTTTTGKEETRIKRREYLGYIGTVDEFKYHILSLALRHHCDVVSEMVVISDGAAWIHKMVQEYFPKAVHILDLYHAKENAGKFSLVVQPDGVSQADFANKMNELMDEGKIDELLDLLEQFKDYKPPAGTVNMYTYVSNHKDMMDYPSYMEKGYFVGSGIIESGNKQIMQNRMKLAGMSWLKENGQHMLSLKAKYESKLWDEVCQLLEKHFYGEDPTTAKFPIQATVI